MRDAPRRSRRRNSAEFKVGAHPDSAQRGASIVSVAREYQFNGYLVVACARCGRPGWRSARHSSARTVGTDVCRCSKSHGLVRGLRIPLLQGAFSAQYARHPFLQCQRTIKTDPGSNNIIDPRVLRGFPFASPISCPTSRFVAPVAGGSCRRGSG